METAPTNLTQFATRCLGPTQAWTCRSRPFGEAEVWRCENAAGHGFFLKHHHPGRAYGQERNTWRRWAPVLGRWLPELVASDDTGRILLSRAAPGEPMAAGQTPDLISGQVFREAGQLQRALDGLPVAEPDAMAPEEAVAKRREAWCRRAQGIVPPGLLKALRHHLPWEERLRGVTRRPCHRDYAPHNWLVDPSATQARLVLLDLGHARDDLWLVDLVRMWATGWPAFPGAKTAFFDGYGRALTPAEEAALEALCLLHGLATLTWSTSHGDPQGAGHGAHILDVILSGGFTSDGLPPPVADLQESSPGGS